MIDIDLGDPIWSTLEPSMNPAPIICSIEMPYTIGIDGEGKEGDVKIAVEAIQYNGLYSVDYYDEDGYPVAK